MPTPSTTIGGPTFLALTSQEAEVIALNMEEAQTLIRTYHSIFCRDPNDAGIKDHLARGTHPTNVDWLKPSYIFRAYEYL